MVNGYSQGSDIREQKIEIKHADDDGWLIIDYNL